MTYSWKNILTFALYYVIIAILFWPNYAVLIIWIVSGFISVGYPYIDRLLFVYVSAPHEPLSQAIRQLLSKRHYVAALRLIRLRGDEQNRLMGRSVIFMVAFIPIGLYVLTSTGSLLASGLLLGIGLQLILDIVRDWKHPEQLKHWLFWPIKRSIVEIELKVVVSIFVLAFIWFTITLIRSYSAFI